MLSSSQALQIVLDNTNRHLPDETVPLVLSPGRILSRPIIAQENIPAAANSSMDGYAVRSTDVVSASVNTPVQLHIIGEVAAGVLFNGIIGTGEAVRIMTGGTIPDGVDAVVEVESTEEEGDRVLIRRSVNPGAYIRPMGEDVTLGAEIIPAGIRITSGSVGVLAALGVTNVPVRLKPKVAIISTGNELVEPHRTPAPGQIRNSSAPALYALMSEAGAEPIDLGIATDDRESLEDKLEQGLRFDVLLTTGGVSAGRYDYVQHLLPEMGVEILFHKVNIKPGMPLLFGVCGSGDTATLVFGLPGNPVSSLVTCRQFVLPAITKLLGSTEVPMQLSARLSEPIAKRDGKRHFIRGIVSTDANGELTVRTTGTQSSGAISSMSQANCLITLPEDSTGASKGDLVRLTLL